jgi:alginate O-acetyltransferase complex protein AlgI
MTKCIIIICLVILSTLMSNLVIIYFAAFITCGWIVYFLFPKKYRYLVMLTYSLIVIFLIAGWLTTFILADAFVIYFGGLLIDNIYKEKVPNPININNKDLQIIKKKRKRKASFIMWSCIILVLISLIGLKYLNSVLYLFKAIFRLNTDEDSYQTITLLIPIGLSYYSLQAISYVVDVKRKKYGAEKNIFKLCLFIIYFPQLIEGPIGRYDRLKMSLLEGEAEPSGENYSNGLILIFYGMMKKFLVADRLAALTSEFFNNYSNYSGQTIALGALIYTIRLYCDFSGVIDIVRGSSECFGINLDENFKQPFFSTTVSEFWRRWHISLGEWFKDYVFYPLSMSRISYKLNKSLRKIHFNAFFASEITMSITLIIVWALTGIWHGASLKYLYYGLYYGILMIFELLIGGLLKKCSSNKVYIFISSIITFILVNIGMLMFGSKDTQSFVYFLSNLFSTNSGNLLSVITLPDLYISIAGIIIVLFIEIRQRFFKPFKVEKRFTVKFVTIFCLFMFLVLFAAYGDGYDYVAPIYEEF